MSQNDSNIEPVWSPRQTIEDLTSFFDQRINVLPPETGSGAPLLMVIAAMCYLAALTICGVLSVNQAVGDWTSELEQTITVQIDPVTLEDGDVDSADVRLEKVLSILQSESGIRTANAISQEDAMRMLEPWLGTADIVSELPIPRLIEVELDISARLNLTDLQARISEKIPGVKIDDHTKWNEQILVFADFLETIAFTILALIIATTIAIIVFATRAGLDAREDIVEVLHLIGARDEYIAQEFQYQNLKLGLYASLIGMGAAFATLILLAALGGILGSADQAYLLPPVEITLNAILSLLLVPLAAAAVIATTTRITVVNVLEKTL